MTGPGARLRHLASRLCTARTMERLIDPVLADLQVEHRDARANGRVWRSRWVLAAGSVSLVKAIGLYGVHQVLDAAQDWPADDRQAVGRAMRWSAAAFLVVTVLLLLPVLRAAPDQMRMVLVRIPQSLPLAIPIGMTLGIFCALAGRAISSRVTGAIVAVALAASCVALATTAWLIPAANQAWRVSMARHIYVTTGAQANLTTGPAELTLNELRHRMDRHRRDGDSATARQFARAYHLRSALPAATFCLALFALSTMPRRAVGRWVPPGAALLACLAYYALLFAGDRLGQQGTLPVPMAMWLPNVTFLVATAALLIGTHCAGPVPREE